jgi:hypothetical protein
MGTLNPQTWNLAVATTLPVGARASHAGAN